MSTLSLPVATDVRAGDGVVTLHTTAEWARLLSRMQQLEKSGAVVLLDLGTMTLSVVGKKERLAPSPNRG